METNNTRTHTHLQIGHFVAQLLALRVGLFDFAVGALQLRLERGDARCQCRNCARLLRVQLAER